MRDKVLKQQSFVLMSSILFTECEWGVSMKKRSIQATYKYSNSHSEKALPSATKEAM
jgi:hypothetical protein